MGVAEPGLYRVPGNQTDVFELKAVFNADPRSRIPDTVTDINTIASLLKLYLREMPEPLFTNALHTDITDAASSATPDNATAFVAALRKLPKAHMDTVEYLFQHLQRVMSASSVNMMTAKNLATCFGPSLVTPSHTDGNEHQSMMVGVGKDNIVVERLLDLPGVLDSVTREEPAGGEGADSGRMKPARGHRARCSLTSYSVVESEYRKVMEDASVPITTFVQFFQVCYTLGCRATRTDYAEAGGTEGASLEYRHFNSWVSHSRLNQFVNLSASKRRGISQAITYFQWFDKDHDGTIGPSEWPSLHADLMRHYDLPENPTDCLAQMDCDGDGVVRLEEYLFWCLKPVEQESRPPTPPPRQSRPSVLASGGDTSDNEPASAVPVPTPRSSMSCATTGEGSPRSSPHPSPRPSPRTSRVGSSPKPKPRARVSTASVSSRNA